jgi:magnesium-transporting ATPase (P-type)
MYSLNIRFVLFRTWQITWIALLGTMQPFILGCVRKNTTYRLHYFLEYFLSCARLLKTILARNDL